MTRGEVVAEVSARRGSLLTEVGVPATDTNGALKQPLDDALALMGVARAERAMADPADGDLFVLAADVMTLRLIRDRLSERFDVGLDGNNFRLQQVFANVTKVLEAAESRLAGALAVLPGGAGATWTGVLDTGFAAPALVRDEFGGVR